MKSFKEVENNRKEYASKTKEDLEGLKIGELRQIARLVGVGGLERDGIQIKPSAARKGELISAVYEACEPQRLLAKETVVIESNAADAIEGLKDYYSDIKHNERFGETVKATFKALQDDTHRRHNPATGEYYPVDGKFLTIVNSFIKSIKHWQSTKPPFDFITDQTLANYSREIARIIDGEIVGEYLGSLRYEAYKETTSQFLRYVKDTTKPIMAERRVQDKEREKRENADVTTIRGVKSVYDWAAKLLDECANTSLNPRKHWRDVVVALLVVTGRRQSEITSSAVFTPIDENHLWFKGQLKSRSHDEFTDGYSIPVFANSEHIIKSVEWLAANGKRHPDPKQAHNLFSRYINEAADSVLGMIDWVSEPQEHDSRLARKAHLFRSIYAVMAKSEFHHEKPNTYELEFIRQILGEKDTTTAAVYDRKLRIID